MLIFSHSCSSFFLFHRIKFSFFHPLSLPSFSISSHFFYLQCHFFSLMRLLWISNSSLLVTSTFYFPFTRLSLVFHLPAFSSQLPHPPKQFRHSPFKIFTLKAFTFPSHLHFSCFFKSADFTISTLLVLPNTRIYPV